MEEIANRYPDAAPHLKALPEHAAQHVGSAALQVTHEDMHPKKEIPGEYGQTQLVADFSEIITDPEYDSGQLADDAVEAAHAGKKELSDVILAGSEMLHAAHDKLTEQGFGPQGLETDEQRNAREKTERDAIYDAACQHGLEVAGAARNESDQAGAVRALESVILLRFMKGDSSRKIFRAAVHEGMGDELLQAAQKTNQLFTGHKYERVSDSMLGTSSLLSMATGKSLDGRFAVTGDANLDSIHPMSGDALKDTVAAMTAPNGWLTPDKAYEAFSSAVQLGNIRRHLKPDLPAEAVGSPDYIYRLIETNADPVVLEQIFACADPRQALEAASHLELPPFQVISMFGVAEEPGEPEELNGDTIRKMIELKGKHPAYFQELVTTQSPGMGVEYDPSEISRGIDALEAAGIKDPVLATVMTTYEDVDAFVKGCSSLSESLAKLGIDANRIPDIAEQAGLSLRHVLYEATNSPDATRLAENLVCRAELADIYNKFYGNLNYPLSHMPAKPELADLPHIRDRIVNLDIPEDVAADMFKSWSTYDAFLVRFDKSPGEQPDPATLRSIALEQMHGLQTQLDALEGFVEAYGLDAMHSVVETFGIYNFARHDSKKLAEQLSAWQAGEQIQSVVVEARSDWNSFNKGGPVFEEEVGNGVFYFEANSGYETARIAVKAGQYERSHGRQPDIKRFIIHAHGTPTGMTMGVNGERIDLAAYQKAAEKGASIDADEINDYKKHLGQNFEIILQSCSVAGELDMKNLAQTMSERHAAPIQAPNVIIHGLTIQKDGTVEFSSKEDELATVKYDG